MGSTMSEIELFLGVFIAAIIIMGIMFIATLFLLWIIERLAEWIL